MKSFVILGVLFGLFISSGTAFAANAQGQFIYFGSGSSSCGKFIAAVNEGNNEQNWIKWNLYQQYVQGYLTGVNSYRADTVNIKEGSDMDGIMASIEKYCRENPLDDFLRGVKDTEDKLYPNRKR